MKNRFKKKRIYAMTLAFKESRYWMTDEEYAWEFAPPVGREFGSPDYERLTASDALTEKAKAATF